MRNKFGGYCWLCKSWLDKGEGRVMFTKEKERRYLGGTMGDYKVAHLQCTVFNLKHKE